MLIRHQSLCCDSSANNSDDFTNLGDQILKDKSLDSAPFLTLGTGSVLDAYRQGRAAIELQVRDRTVNGDRAEFIAVYNASMIGIETDILWSRNDVLKRNVDGSLESDFNQPVLVGIIEVTEDGKERRRSGVLSVVRLNALDRFSDRQAEILDVPILRLEVVRRVINDECGPSLVGRWVRLQFVNGNRVDEMIKSGTQVVDGIAENQSPQCERRRHHNRDDDAMTSEITIHLAGECVRTLVHPGNKLLIQQASVFLRPIYLANNAV